jgi:hypothetical protein
MDHGVDGRYLQDENSSGEEKVIDFNVQELGKKPYLPKKEICHLLIVVAI